MILAYHRINPWHTNDALTVSPDNFAKQMDYLLCKKLKPVSLSGYLDSRNKKTESADCFLSKSISPVKEFSITFDDGFSDNYKYALPILKEKQIPFTVFLCVSFIGTDRLFDRYTNIEKDRFLNWEQVCSMARENVTFGSHCLTHPHLTQIPEETAKKEICESKNILEEKTGRAIDFFCYPYGEYNSNTIKTVKEAGYKAGLVTQGKIVRERRFTIRRFGVYGHNNLLIYRTKVWREILKDLYSFCLR